MKSGYDQFFQNARKVADQQGGVKFNKKPSPTRLHLDLASEDVEQQIRRRMNMGAPKKRKKSFCSLETCRCVLHGIDDRCVGISESRRSRKSY
ncbi:VOC family protein [Bdellovibrio bacteriovorus]|uniref:VOC family protein n=1 Tax=Bdellovibrio bacteriovorus TaxID=959 RepID=UPI0035A83E63